MDDPEFMSLLDQPVNGKHAEDLALAQRVDFYTTDLIARERAKEKARNAPGEEIDDVALRYAPVDWQAHWSSVTEEVNWLFPPILEAGTLNALFGPAGTGKSLLALDMAVEVVREGGTVCYIDDENRITDTVERLKAFGCSPQEIKDLLLFNFAGLPPLDTTEGGTHLAAVADHYKPDLIVLDTTSRMVEGDENASSTYLTMYRKSLVPLKARGVTVLRIDHAGKDPGRGQRGSSAKDGDVDTIWKLTLEDGDMLALERTKSRSGHGEGWISVQRIRTPYLHHDWQALDRMPVTPQIEEWSARFDRWGIPLDAGRPTLRAAIAERTSDNGNRVSTTLLALVAKYRKSLSQGNSTDNLGTIPGQQEFIAPF